MHISFRQGVVQAPNAFLQANGSTVNLSIAEPAQVIATFADGTANYLLVERQPVTGAWTGPFISGTDYWLFWDISATTGLRTFGHTALEPVEGPTAPLAPQNDQHWFDTTTGKMKVWNATATRWVTKIRVFAGKYESATVFQSASLNAPAFTGSQVGVYASTEVDAGVIVFDEGGAPLKHSNGALFTTEDVVSANIGSTSQVKVGAVVIEAVATSAIPAYSIVNFSGFHQVELATNVMMGEGAYGMIETDAIIGDIVNVALQGVITNPAWDWSAEGVNTPLYVNTSGALTTSRPPNAVVVGTIVDTNTILLRPSLQTINMDGVAPVPATTSTLGIVRLSTASGTPGTPVVVETSDPRLVPAGGTTGQALVKTSNTNYATSWQTVSGGGGGGGILFTLSVGSSNHHHTALLDVADAETLIATTNMLLDGDDPAQPSVNVVSLTNPLGTPLSHTHVVTIKYNWERQSFWVSNIATNHGHEGQLAGAPNLWQLPDTQLPTPPGYPADGDYLRFFKRRGAATVAILTPGSGYTDGVYPDVQLSGASGFNLRVNVTVTGGQVTNLVITNPGREHVQADIVIDESSQLPLGSGFQAQVTTLTDDGYWKNTAPEVEVQHFRMTPLSGMTFNNSPVTLFSTQIPSVPWAEFVTYDAYPGRFFFDRAGTYRVDVEVRLQASVAWPADNTEYGLIVSALGGANVWGPDEIVFHRAAPGTGSRQNVVTGSGTFYIGSYDVDPAPYGNFSLGVFANSVASPSTAINATLWVTFTRLTLPYTVT